MATLLTKDFYTVNEIAKILQVAPLTIYRLTDKGHLQAYRVGRALRISREDLQAYLTKVKTRGRNGADHETIEEGMEKR